MDKLLYVSLPTPEDRVSILKAISDKITFSPEVDLQKIGTSKKAEGYSGADCAALLREAGLAVLKETFSTPAKEQSDVMDNDANNEEPPLKLCIRPHHFDYAFDHVVPSVSPKDQARYLRMRDRMAQARSRAAIMAEVEKDEEDEKANAGNSNAAEPAT